MYESGTTASGHPYLAMEFLENGSLADRMQTLRGPLPWSEAVAMTVQVAGALQCAHDRGLLVARNAHQANKKPAPRRGFSFLRNLAPEVGLEPTTP